LAFVSYAFGQINRVSRGITPSNRRRDQWIAFVTSTQTLLSNGFPNAHPQFFFSFSKSAHHTLSRAKKFPGAVFAPGNFFVHFTLDNV
jgi:hypothetical protein